MINVAGYDNMRLTKPEKDVSPRTTFDSTNRPH